MRQAKEGDWIKYGDHTGYVMEITIYGNLRVYFTCCHIKKYLQKYDNYKLNNETAKGVKEELINDALDSRDYEWLRG
jgi:hypothetical protein